MSDNNEIFAALANSFIALYFVDLDTGRYRNYVLHESIAELSKMWEKCPNFEDLVRACLESEMVHPDDRIGMFSFCQDNAGLKKSLRNQKRISMNFRRRCAEGYRWTKVSIVKKGGEDDEAHAVLVAFNECDDEVRSEQALRGSLAILQQEQRPAEAINSLLAHAGECYGADRAYIFEYGRTKATMNNTYEWCREGIEPMIAKLQDLPTVHIDGWMREFERKGAFYMDALDSDDNTEEGRRILSMQGIKWLIAAPILRDGEIVGFIGVDNPTLLKREIRLLRAVATVAYAEIVKSRENGEQYVTLGKLADAFLSVYYVDLSRDYIRTWKIDDEYAYKYGSVKSYSGAMIEYMRSGIIEKDRERCTEMVSPEYVLNEFRTKDRYSIETTDIMLGYERNIVFDFIKVSDDGNNFVACCRDVTDVVKARQEQVERERAAAKKNEILSDLTRTLYGYSITVCLEDGSYSLIAGTGSDEAVAAMNEAGDYRELFNAMLARVRPQYHAAIRKLVSLDRLRMDRSRIGYAGTVKYQLVGDEETAPWGEVVVSFSIGEDGRRIANVLGRDISEFQRESARHEREMKAAAARDQMLSGITTTLYGFNITVNLKKNTYSFIRGTGTDRICSIFEEGLGHPYTEIVDRFIAGIPGNFRNDGYRVLGRDLLLLHSGKSGHIGTRVLHWRSPEGRGFWIEVHGFIAADEHGDPIVNLLGRDVTEEHDARERREQEQRAAAAKDQILAGITMSIYGYNLAINLQTEKCSVVRGTGMDCIVDLVEEHDDYPDVFAAFRKRLSAEDFSKAGELFALESMRAQAEKGVTGFVGRAEYEYDCPVHGRHWHRANLIITRNENGEPMANVLARDVTEEHRLLETAAKLERAEAASKAKSEFLFNVSHDVRTPMHAIMGFADIALEEVKRKGEKANSADGTRLSVVEDSLSKIKKSGELLFSLLNSVLDVSRLEVGEAKLVESPGDVMYSFESVQSTMTEIAKEKDISLTFEFGEITNRYVYADYEKAGRIFMNILTNAVKYTKDGGRIRVRCEEVKRKKEKVKSELEGEEVKRAVVNSSLEIDGDSSLYPSSFLLFPSKKPGTYAFYRYIFEDTGIGMAPEFVEKLYERFSREKNTTMGGVSGIGLGMSICKAFVDMMGGTIECRSRKGEGTTFIVELPFRLQPQGQHRYLDPRTGRELDASAESAPRADRDFKGRRVLLVDDSKMNLVVARHYLKKFGFEHETADDGTVAVGQVAKHGPGYYDLILMDIQMPTMDGYEATRQIRKWEGEVRQRDPAYKPIPIIAWSANAFEEDREKSRAAGMNDHVAKGANPAQLQETISRLL